MASEEVQHDWYKIVGCSIDDSTEFIAKSIRKLALKYHPDKNATEAAAQMFLLVQKAKEVLLDGTLRSEYDVAIRKVSKRKEYDEIRLTQMDAKKRKMKDNLEERMKQAKEQSSNINSDNISANVPSRKKNIDLDHIRKENAERMEAQRVENSRRESELKHKLEQARMESNISRFDISKDDNKNALKVKWRKNDNSHTEDSLIAFFERYGSIESVSFDQSKGSSAVIFFTEEKSASIAVEQLFDSTIFRVSKYLSSKKSDVFSHVYKSSDSGTALPTESLFTPHMRDALEREELSKGIQFVQNFESDPKAAEPTSNRVGSSIFSAPKLSNEGLRNKESDILKKMLEAANAAKSRIQKNDTDVNNPHINESS
jgi:curved DNA-binding protein CbpA